MIAIYIASKIRHFRSGDLRNCVNNKKAPAWKIATI